MVDGSSHGVDEPSQAQPSAEDARRFLRYVVEETLAAEQLEIQDIRDGY
jgi:hypothetical protein